MHMNCKGKLIDLSQPKVMGILNSTPDSFFSGSRVENLDRALKVAEQMLADGADFLDVGGMSTRPQSDEVSESEELNRVLPLIEAVLNEFPETLVSIDTYRSKVAKEAVHVGAALVNDISAGSLDPALFSTVAELNVPYLLMHMQGTPKTMQQNPTYENVVVEINQFFSEKINELQELGVKDILIDPGFGFGKTRKHNYELMQNLNLIAWGEYPILVGISRKSMVTNLLNVSAADALNGTTALHMIALERGANILRVHDVKEAREVIQIWEELQEAKG